jgi:Glyoxalase/Bleomycin resistance protein/Dioxygenase superfamily
VSSAADALLDYVVNAERISMTIAARPDIDCEQHHATLSVSDVRAAADFYANKLGFIVAFTEGDPPTFAGVNLGHVQIFESKGTPAPQGC